MDAAAGGVYGVDSYTASWAVSKGWPSKESVFYPLPQAIEAAQKHGTIVAMTAGDAGVVERHHSEMWQAIDRGIDLLFTNRTEAEALCKYLPAQLQQQQGAEAPQQQQQRAVDGVLKTVDMDGLDGHPLHHHSKGSGSHPGGVCSAAEAAALRLGPHCSLVRSGGERAYQI